MLNTVVASIDLSAFRHNLDVVRTLCPRSKVMAMVKADAYGHGLLAVAQALGASDGFAVARLQEAVLLRRAGIRQRILLLATLLSSSDLVACSDLEIDVTAHDRQSVESIVVHTRAAPLRVWLELDSGMHRMGLNPEAFIEADRCLHAASGVVELIHLTHFSSAERAHEKTNLQEVASFKACREAVSRAPASLANSASLILRSDTHGEWVRPGIMLYGVNPVAEQSSLPLRVAMTLRASIISDRTIGAGEPVGYNGRWNS